MRLLGFERVELRAGESRSVTLTADRRLLARFDGAAGGWRVAGGTYRVAVGRAAGVLDLAGETTLAEATFGA
jgi:beta-glucosidase